MHLRKENSTLNNLAKSFSQKLIVCCFLTFCSLSISFFYTNIQVQANASSSNVLMLGATLNDLSFEDKSRFSKYNILERAFTSGDNVKDLVKQSNPVAVVIRQPSGGVYEYSPDGTLIKKLTMKAEMQKMVEKQPSTNLPQNLPSRIPPLSASINNRYPSMPHSPMMMGPPMAHPIMGSCSVCGPPFYVPPYRHKFMFGPYDVRRPPRGPLMSPITSVALPPMAHPIMSGPPMQMPPPQRMQGVQQVTMPNNMRPTLVPPPTFLSQRPNNPFPGANVPSYLYPGKSEYGYLPGEGDIDPPPGIGNSRRALKQLAGLAQNTAYPFWFDNFLQTDANATQFLGNNIGGANVGTNAGFPTLNFTADTTANAAVVGGQWTQTGLGIGSLLADSFLEAREIQARRNYRRRQAAGTANYYYPDPANTFYPSTPYQPVPNRSWY